MVNSPLSLRLGSYLAIWVGYLAFMATHAPRGIDWLSWHLQRVYSAVQYLKINGYLSSYGFSIWTTCQDCSLAAAEWHDKIYLSSTALKLTPYIVLNHFWGMEALQRYGPLIDRTVIFVAAAVAAELVIRSVRSYSPAPPSYVVGVGFFALFAAAPWTYKMLLSSWFEIYFLMFFLAGLLSFAHERNRQACVMLLLAGMFHYQWAVAVATLYVLLFLISAGVEDGRNSIAYEPPFAKRPHGRVAIVLALILPALTELALRLLAQQSFNSSDGSPLLTRIGVSGSDMHNGGLLGALQFLGGNRITLCLAERGAGGGLGSLNDAITSYNCILSIAGMATVSLTAIVGVVVLVKKSTPAKWMIFPLAYALLIFVTMLQQSMSAHLLGYSYVFSFLFGAGIVALMVQFSQMIHSVALGIALSIPCVIGILLLSIRVSMLTGING